MFTLFADWRALAEEDISTEIEKLRAAHCRYAEYLDRKPPANPPSIITECPAALIVSARS